MVSSVNTASLLGLDVQEITVEVDYRQGLSSFTIVGLADRSIQESKERIISAIKNANAEFIPKRITVNLAPAPFYKTGSSFDLAIAVGYLVSTGQIQLSSCKQMFLGELGLSGDVRSVRGIFPTLSEAVKLGYDEVFIPATNFPETRLIQDIRIYPVSSLDQLIRHFKGNRIVTPVYKDATSSKQPTPSIFDLVQGQHRAKRAVEIAVAGGHNILLIGPPGSGKSMLAKSMPEILPSMSKEEIWEVTKLYSIAGLLKKDQHYITERPFRSPHHTVTRAAMIGGGISANPGEVSLSHKGFLFLDEFPEFSSSIRETLREPLESKRISLSRARYKLTYPAEFGLILAANPCKCGYYGDQEIECRCTLGQVQKYQGRLSGPILDRIDIKLRLNRVKSSLLVSDNTLSESNIVRLRVSKARIIQLDRGGEINSNVSQYKLKRILFLGPKEKNLIADAIDKLALSPRGYYRVLRVARTIADLDQSENVKENHLAEALSYRV